MNYTILEIENKLISIIAKMELDGVKIDSKKLIKTQEDLEKLKTKYQSDIENIAGSTVNLNSNEQLSNLLFDTLKITPKNTKRGKNGCYAVDKNHLKKLTQAHEIIEMLLQFRKTETLLKFCEGLCKAIHPKTDRLHCNLNQIGTATGRFSSSKPNLQNIPNVKVTDSEKDELKRLAATFREVFIPKRGCQFICSDYSQIELRVVSDMSGDPYLICLLYTSPSPRDQRGSRMPSSA